MKRIVTLRVHPLDHGPSYIRFEDVLGRRGHEVILLSWDWEGSGPNDLEFDTYRVVRLVTKLPNLPAGGIVFFPLWFAFSLRWLLDLHPAHVVAFNLDSLVPAVAYRLMRHVPTTLYFLDSYPGAFPPRTPKWFRTLFIGIEHAVSRLSDFIIFVDEARSAQLSFTTLPEESIVVYNGPATLPVSAKWPSDSSSRLRIFYGGGLHEDRGLRSLVNAVRTIPSVQLVIAGEGPLKEAMEDATRGCENVTFLGWIPHEEIMQYTLGADVIPCFYDPRIPNNRLASPNKLFEAMALGKYVLTNSGQRAADYVQEHDIGSVVNYDNEAEIAGCILRLVDNRDRLEDVAKRAPRIFEANYSSKANLLRLEPYFKRFGL